MELITVLLVIVIAAITGMIVELKHINKDIDALKATISAPTTVEFDEKQLKDIQEADEEAAYDFNNIFKQLNEFMTDGEGVNG